jgi:hypothetical protein
MMDSRLEVISDGVHKTTHGSGSVGRESWLGRASATRLVLCMRSEKCAAHEEGRPAPESAKAMSEKRVL